MRLVKVVKTASVVFMFMSSVEARAYSPGDVEEICKKPQVREFSLPTYEEPEKIEVAPESKFSFILSEWTDPATIKLTMKEQSVPFIVESNNSFHKVTAIIPAELTGHFVRINLFSKAILGCYDQKGWLIKVSERWFLKIIVKSFWQNLKNLYNYKTQLQTSSSRSSLKTKSK